MPLDVTTTPRRLGIYHVPNITYSDFLTDKWRTISQGLGLSSSSTEKTIRTLLSPWGSRPIGVRCAPPSFVSADGFPAELSISWQQPSATPELRILFESLGPQPTPSSNQAAGRALTHRLADTHGVSLHRYRAIEDLFLTSSPQPYRPTIWHSLAWRPPHAPRYKVYLNPQCQGLDRTGDLVDEAMRRLDLADAWAPVRKRLSELIEDGHELEFLALDLDAHPDARVKVYFRHHPMRRSQLEAVASLAHRHDPARTARAWQAIYGDQETVDNEPLTCLAFRAGNPGPDEANLYLRLPDNAPSDADALERITALMHAEGIDPHPYRKALTEVAPAPLAATTSLQELVSYRTTAAHLPADLGVYLRFSPYTDEPPTM